MNSLTKTLAIPALLLSISWATPVPAHTKDRSSSSQQDNTKQNKRDRSPDAVTADQQKNTVSDRELTKKIRGALVSDKSMSTYAHNVKVVSQNGVVTLKGPVHSETEKAAIH